MHSKGTHEGCIEQIVRMFRDRLYNGKSDVLVDDTNRIRLDDWEMDQDVQNEVKKVGDDHY